MEITKYETIKWIARYLKLADLEINPIELFSLFVRLQHDAIQHWGKTFLVKSEYTNYELIKQRHIQQRIKSKLVSIINDGLLFEYLK